MHSFIFIFSLPETTVLLHHEFKTNKKKIKLHEGWDVLQRKASKKQQKAPNEPKKPMQRSKRQIREAQIPLKNPLN